MPLVPINDVGKVGIIEDIPPYNIPPNAWSGGNNVRFLDNGVKKCSGYEEVFATCPFAPYHIVPLEAGGTYYWIAFGLTDAAVYSGSSWVDITRQTTGALSGTINNSVTTITLSDASAFPSSGTIALGTKAIADGSSNGYEVITYSGKSTNDLTGCSRAATDPATGAASTAAEHTTAYPVVPISTTATGDNDYNATAAENWSSTRLGGLLVATNGYDEPQMWPLSSTGVPATTVPLRALQNWQSTTYYCKSISAFRTFLVGLNWTKDSVEHPRLVKWSTEAASFNAPNTWNEADATLDAGEYQLIETTGPILDGLPLGDSFIIYKEDSTYIMNYVGTPYIFSFKTLSPTVGLLTKNAVKEYEGGHFFIGNSDCYINNGQQITPLLPNRLRREMFSTINGDEYSKAFVAADYTRNEMLACYPSGSATFCNKALIWNWKENTLSIRDLPDLAHINSGIAEIVAGATWASSTSTWDAGSGAWGTKNYAGVLKNLVFADPVSTKLYRDDSGNQDDTTDMTAYIERTGYDLGDPSSVKFVRAVWPKIEVSGSNTINVYVGSQMSTEEGVTWEGPTTFNPNTQSKVSCRVTGKFFGVKFESTGDFDWKLHGVEFEVQPRGRRGSVMQ